jgi:hypothetical protein
MFGLGGIRKLNDGWIAKQAAHEAQLNLAREHADRAAAEQFVATEQFDAMTLHAEAQESRERFAAAQAHAHYKCGGTLRPSLVIGHDSNGNDIVLR